MPAKNKCWLYKYINEDQYRNWTSVYLKESSAIEDAAKQVVNLADEELTGIGWEEDDVEPGMLKEVISLASGGKYQEAYDAWQEYASHVSATTTVEVEEADLIEG